MRKVDRMDGYVRFYDSEDEFIIEIDKDEVVFCFENLDGYKDFNVTREDGILFDEVEMLYANILNSRNHMSKIYEPDIVQGDRIEVKSCNPKTEHNSFSLKKVNPDHYRFHFITKDDYPEVSICFNGLDADRHIYGPYDRMFVHMYNNLYTYDYEEGNELKLKKQ